MWNSVPGFFFHQEVGTVMLNPSSIWTIPPCSLIFVVLHPVPSARSATSTPAAVMHFFIIVSVLFFIMESFTLCPAETPDG